VIRRDDGVKFPAHRSHKNCIRWKGPLDSGSSRGWLQKLRVLAAKPSAITCVRVESAQRDPRRFNPEPGLQPTARDARGFNDGLRAQIFDDAAKGNVGRGKHDAELVRREHHRDARSSQRCEHLGVTGEVITPSQKRRLVDGTGHDSFDVSRLRHLHGSLDR
jgi:hypothetical protein